jgi:hypothetical protein
MEIPGFSKIYSENRERKAELKNLKNVQLGQKRNVFTIADKGGCGC